MRVFVSGSGGNIGRHIVRHLEGAGHDVVGFDLSDGQDILDQASVGDAMRGCDAVVHLAAIRSDSRGAPLDIMATNVGGTLNVLRAAKAASISRLVYFSSVQVFGIAEGEQAPCYLPIDDDHPRNPGRPYGMSKRMAEDLCAIFTQETRIATVCLRPVAVWAAPDYVRIAEARRRDPTYEWSPYWEFGAFVDVDDVAAATLCALTCPDQGHVRALLCASDISASAPAREMARRLLPDVPWRGGADYDADPYRSLVDTTPARRVLGWSPMRRWSKG